MLNKERPKGRKYSEVMGLALTPDMWQRLDNASKRLDVSKGVIVRRALQMHLVDLGEYTDKGKTDVLPD